MSVIGEIYPNLRRFLGYAPGKRYLQVSHRLKRVHSHVQECLIQKIRIAHYERMKSV